MVRMTGVWAKEFPQICRGDTFLLIKGVFLGGSPSIYVLLYKRYIYIYTCVYFCKMYNIYIYIYFVFVHIFIYTCISISRWWQLKYFLEFSPRKLGKMNPI